VWVADPLQAGEGQRLRKTFDAIEDAELWRSQARVQAQREAGVLLKRHGATPTLREAGDALLAGMESGAIRKRGGGEYRAGVIRAYRRGLTLNVYPTLGAWSLDTIRQSDLLGLVERLQERGLAPSTIKNALDPVRVIYRRAVARDIVATNPTTNLEMPSGEKRRDRVADPSEAALLVAALPRPYDRSLWATALYCGLRAGELRALRWRDVDLARGRIHVRENLPIDARRVNADTETTDPKTKAGRREVPIAPPAHEALLDWKSCTLPPLDAYVWPADDGGVFARTSVMKRARAAWKKAKLTEIGLHEVRHSAVSMWIASGWSVKVVSELIGHASVSITLDRYGHLFPAALDDAAAAFAAYLERSDTARRVDQLGQEDIR
jgi:integrase